MSGVVYHWKHGWIPLDHTAALSKAKGNHAAAEKMLADAHTSRGITSRQDVAKAVRDLPNLPPSERGAATTQLHQAAAHHNSTDLLPQTIRGTDQFGRPTTFTGHAQGSPATRGGTVGTVYSVHNGSDKSGLDATARGTVFVPALNQEAAKAQARTMSPAELRAQTQGDFRVGDEVTLKTSSGRRIGRVVDVNERGQLIVHVPGHGKLTLGAENLRHDISPATRAAEASRNGWDFRKTPLDRLHRVISGDYPDPMKEAARAELQRRMKGAK